MSSRTRVSMGVAAAGAAFGLLARRQGRRSLARARDRLEREARYERGRLAGLVYRLRGGHAEPDVSDEMLAQRVRSRLGSLTKRLDLPNVRVSALDHVVFLTGDVGSASDADRVERAALRTSGVRGVSSYLHLGLRPGDTRPSEGRAVTASSDALTRLLQAAVRGGCTEATAFRAVHAVLGTLAERLPEQQFRHVAAHLPVDVRALAVPPHRRGSRPPVRHARDFVAAVMAADGITLAQAHTVTTSVLAELRSLVPEEARSVAAVLPTDIETMWSSVGT